MSPKRISWVATVSFSLTTGHDAEVQQPVQRAERVGVLAAAHEVIGGQQHLADGDAVRAEGLGVAGHQQALAHAGGGLLGGEVARALRPGPAGPGRRRSRRRTPG